MWTPENVHEVHLRARWNKKEPLAPVLWQCSPLLKHHILLKAGAGLKKGKRWQQTWSTINQCAFPTRRAWEMFYPKTVFFHFITCTSDWDTEPELGLSSSWFALPSTVMESNYALCKMYLGNQVFCQEILLRGFLLGKLSICLSLWYLHLKGECFVKRQQGHPRVEKVGCCNCCNWDAEQRDAGTPRNSTGPQYTGARQAAASLSCKPPPSLPLPCTRC